MEMTPTAVLPSRRRGWAPWRERLSEGRVLERSYDPVPASYWVTATLGALVVIGCYATAWWVPRVAADFASTAVAPLVPGFGFALVALFGTAVGAVVAAAPFIALRWPWLGIAWALLPGGFCLFYGTPLPFGLIATLGAVALTAAWRRPVAAVVATVSALLVVWLWIGSATTMAAPFRSTIELRNTSRWEVGAVYTVALFLLLAGALWLRQVAQREEQRRALTARAGAVEEQAAVVGERARLARDLHDVVAHHVSLIAVRAETAPYTHPGLDDEARALLAEVAGDARMALDELRGVLGILGRAGDGSRAPQPSWADVPALVTRAREAGAVVALEGDQHAEVAPAVGYVAYRVVQESLTNARKHAPGHPVLVRLEATPALLAVQVISGGATVAPVPGAGHGLVGMRERVEAVGGRLRAGAADGEFRVEATLPRGVGR